MLHQVLLFPAGATVRLALQVPGVTQRIIYYVEPSTGTWKEPLTIYRWGPNLDDKGAYSNPNDPNPGTNWTKEALIDGVSDETLTADGCDTDGNGSDETYQGFFACVVDDDGDSPIGAEILTDTNGRLAKLTKMMLVPQISMEMV